MAKAKLPHASDWQARNINDWNVTTYHAYLSHIHNEKYNIPYTPFRSWTMEKGQLKNFLNEINDKKLAKQFIDECFKTYKPTPQYPGLSFGFCYTYMRSSILPKLYKQTSAAASKEKYEEKQGKLSIDDMIDLL